ncbi:hypothetical protein [Streptomyces xantholiticus]|uniref:hypothetical protein n=1 Tax=Streptomyces xantholiticus TaxID=68285 RepID=UPI00357161BD
MLERTDAQGMTVGLNVLQGSGARRLYERHGFVAEAKDAIDVSWCARRGRAPLRKPDLRRCEAGQPADLLEERRSSS